MQDLERMIDEKIAAHEAAIADLRIAKRVILKELGPVSSLSGVPTIPVTTGKDNTRSNPDDGDEGEFPEVIGDDLRDISIRDAAIAILTEAKGESVHYRKVARRAMERGYCGKTGDPIKITRSFIDIMRRMPELKRLGPTFKIK